MFKLIKKFTPNFVKKVISKYINNQLIINYYKTNYKKKALLSYIIIPFKMDSLSHTNFFEAQSWAKILHELEYSVDIIHYDNCKKINFAEYDLICGFGDVFQKYFEQNSKHQSKTIYYGAGMHVCHQNLVSLQRVKDVYLKKKIWLGKSARFVEKTWTHQTTLVDGIIALGNTVCADSYRKHYNGLILPLVAPFFKTQDAIEIMNNREENSNKHFLWFGSAGLIHKGLDLLLDYFIKNTDVTLHICGSIENEPEFVEAYKAELYQMSNIITHGFINIDNQKFKDILNRCSFIIFPSCSEGGAPSVITIIGNGGLIPIISKETTISTGHEIWIDSFDYEGIDKAIEVARNMTNKEILDSQTKNYNYVKTYHTKEEYYNKLRLSIIKILEKNDEM